MKTLSYALLGLLARGSCSGYDLTQQLQGIGVFWSAGHSHVYPELAALEKAGYVAHQVVEQQERPDKKVYTLTDTGRDALQRWVLDATEPVVTRDELLLKTYSAWLVEPLQVAPVYRHHEQVHLMRVAKYQARLAEIEQLVGGMPQDMTSPHFSSYALLKRGAISEQSYADWCAWLASQLEQSH